MNSINLGSRMHSSDSGECFRPTCRVGGGGDLPISGCANVQP